MQHGLLLLLALSTFTLHGALLFGGAIATGPRRMLRGSPVTKRAASPIPLRVEDTPARIASTIILGAKALHPSGFFNVVWRVA
jgi:hypothetical protein